MRKLMALVLVFVALSIGSIVPTQDAQAGGPRTTVPWLQIYQVDPQSLYADGVTTFVVAYDTTDIGMVEEIQFCYDSRCGSSSPAFDLGGYHTTPWGYRHRGWNWIGVSPAPSQVYARAVVATQNGQREVMTTAQLGLQAVSHASGEVWPFVDQVPQKLGDPILIRIERNLGLPIIHSDVCFVGMTWSCQYENTEDWGMALNGAGTQILKGLTLSPPNVARQGPNGKLSNFPDGAQIRMRYTMIDGSSIEYWHPPLRFLAP